MVSLSSRRPASKQTADGAERANRESCTGTDDSYWGTRNRTYEGLNSRQPLYVRMAGRYSTPPYLQRQDERHFFVTVFKTVDSFFAQAAEDCLSFALAVCTPLAS